MPTTIDLAPILALPVEERQAIADLIRDSVEADTRSDTDELPPAFVAELRRRVAEHEADTGSAIPWEVVKARLLERCKK
jgi:putative addiction module component (TIGR02574 family)